MIFMNCDINRFIEDHIEMMENGNWEQIYNELREYDVETVSHFNTLMYRVGIQPLEKMTYVPRLFLTWSPLTKIPPVPDDISRILDMAFMESKLESIKLPKHLEYIGSQAFAMCHNLKEIVLPNTVETIGMSAFYNCDHLERIVIGNNVKYIMDKAFQQCHKLNDIYYRGDFEDWERIHMLPEVFHRTGNDKFPTIHYNYQGN